MTAPSLGTQSPPVGPPGRAAASSRVSGAAQTVVRLWPYALVGVVVAVLGLPMIEYPFGSDQAIFAEIGRTISNGGFPYTDAWDQKPPGIFLIYTVAIHGPLGVMRNVRVFDLVWVVTTAIVLMELGRRWWTLPAGAIGGLLYGALYVTTTGYWHSAQPDGFLALPLLLAMLLYDVAAGVPGAQPPSGGGWGTVRGPQVQGEAARGSDRSLLNRRRLILLAAGALIGFAFQLRFIVLMLVPFLPMVEMTPLTWRARLRLWWDRMLWLGIGFALVQGVLLLYLAVGGALGEFIAATRFASGYTLLGGPYAPDGLTTGKYLETVRLSFLFWALGKLLLTAPAVVGGFLGVFVLRERRVQQMVLFAVLCYTGIALQGKFFPYHYLYLLPFMALLAGWAWDRTFRLLARSGGRRLAFGGGALVVVGLGLSTPEVVDSAWYQWRGYVHYHTEPENRESYYDYFGPWNGGTFSYRASRETAYYIQRRTAPDDFIYVWGYDPLVYLLAQRQSSSRFIYSFPLMSDWAPRAWQQEFLAELEARPPVYFAVQRYEGARWITGHSVDTGEYIAWFPELDAWLSQNYDFEMEIEDYLIYRRK